MAQEFEQNPTVSKPSLPGWHGAGTTSLRWVSSCPGSIRVTARAREASMPGKKMNFDVVREIALALPGVEQGTIHGAPSLKVRGKLLACPAIHRSAEPNTLAVRIDHAQRAKLVEAEPGVYYVTDHYVKYPTVLVRLSRIDRNSLKDLLGMAWRFVSPKPKTAARKRAV
jgi:hypothetical protein